MPTQSEAAFLDISEVTSMVHMPVNIEIFIADVGGGGEACRVWGAEGVEWIYLGYAGVSQESTLLRRPGRSL